MFVCDVALDDMRVTFCGDGIMIYFEFIYLFIFDLPTKAFCNWCLGRGCVFDLAKDSCT